MKEKIEEENSYRSALNRRDDDDDRRFLVVLAVNRVGNAVASLKYPQISINRFSWNSSGGCQKCVFYAKRQKIPPYIRSPPFPASIRSSHKYLSSLVRIYLDFVHTSSEKATKIYIMEYKWTNGECWMDTRALEEHDVTSFGCPMCCPVLFDTFIGSANSRDRFFAFASDDRGTTQN